MDIRQFCTEFFQIRDVGLLEKLEQVAKIRKVSKGEILVQAGEEQLEAAFLITGLFRGYYVDSEGKEVTDCFAYRYGDSVMASIALNDVVQIALEALEDSEIFCISLQEVDKLMSQYLEVSKLSYGCLIRSLRMHWNMKVALTRFSAPERYQWFLQAYPGLIDLVKKKHVASFLNLTPQTLSQQRRSEKEGIET
ncbi:MAG: Crp/Fnr family transcriptional regulator [Clostridia bacterium]|nr:Crp/Fnr family transcriptional regulator [Clostridia bacterium]